MLASQKTIHFSDIIVCLFLYGSRSDNIVFLDTRFLGLSLLLLPSFCSAVKLHSSSSLVTYLVNSRNHQRNIFYLSFESHAIQPTKHHVANQQEPSVESNRDELPRPRLPQRLPVYNEISPNRLATGPPRHARHHWIRSGDSYRSDRKLRCSMLRFLPWA
ncbi:hypothetical protein MJO28_016820 [Puccinia striiformis f. sp. tritici]|nr:hypothetical protein Pst134EB_026506 [Puccinia striiformis f. sp. tritici]KAI7935290.1 hypothetical protein MJO28_016817 [Puccinia striiformis f. sp. tritici]KAI7935293.1 hypothetical protein MJO28_016820 [Puccinia striiformis f. sp. tritici]KAI7941292.1 hypothetical protein MJO29_013366 [Puccinia striiformis f. sp. tritici]